MDFVKLLHSFNRINVLLLAGGIFMIVYSAGDVMTMVKPARDFEYLMDNGVEKGTHVKGEVYYTFDCFGSEETWRENSRTGAKSQSKISHYFYAIPITDTYVTGLEIPAGDYADMEQLLEETVAYLDGADYPSTVVNVNGAVKVMDQNLQKYFQEYLLDVGYTQEEVDAMGEPLVIDQIETTTGAIGMFIAGIILIGIGIFLYIREYKKQY